MAKYDILLQNNGSKQYFIVSGVNSTYENHLYIQFDEFPMPEKAEDGEYTYAVIRNSLSGVVYTPKNGLIDSVVSYSGQSYTLRDLKPIMGVLRIGEVEEKNIYNEQTKNKTYYYKK